MESNLSKLVLKAIMGVPFALIVWMLVHVLTHATLYLLDMFRGLEDDWIQQNKQNK